jgi:hypothetical protein
MKSALFLRIEWNGVENDVENQLKVERDPTKCRFQTQKNTSRLDWLQISASQKHLYEPALSNGDCMLFQAVSVIPLEALALSERHVLLSSFGNRELTIALQTI